MTAAFSVEPAQALAPDWAPPSPLVFASPHSGDAYPSDMGARDGLSGFSLRSAEDALVDRLLDGCAPMGPPLIRGLVGRAYVDLNRAPADMDPELIETSVAPEAASARARAGYGVVPRLAGDGTPLYERRLTEVEARDRVARVHEPYHHALTRMMEAARARHGFAILVDWHSMPARAVAGGRSVRPLDVVLGDRHGGACAPAITRHVRALFEAPAWRVGLNHPYAGGYATQTWGRPQEGFHALQIELNRRLYLDEATLTPTAGFGRAQAVIRRVMAGLAAHPWPRAELTA